MRKDVAKSRKRLTENTKRQQKQRRKIEKEWKNIEMKKIEIKEKVEKIKTEIGRMIMKEGRTGIEKKRIEKGEGGSKKRVIIENTETENMSMKEMTGLQEGRSIRKMVKMNSQTGDVIPIEMQKETKEISAKIERQRKHRKIDIIKVVEIKIVKIGIGVDREVKRIGIEIEKIGREILQKVGIEIMKKKETEKTIDIKTVEIDKEIIKLRIMLEIGTNLEMNK